MRYTDSRKLTPETDANHKTASPQPIRRISSQTLLGPDGKLIIDHDGQEYLLRKTQAGSQLLELKATWSTAACQPEFYGADILVRHDR